MAYRRKGSGKPPSSEAPSHSDEPPSPQGTDPEPLWKRGTNSESDGNAGAPEESLGPALRQTSGQATLDTAAKLRAADARHSVCGPKGTEDSPSTRCGVCGRRTFLFALPGQSEKYCFECSADVATTHLLATEIDAATMAGQDANSLITEFELLSSRLLARAQSA